MSTLIVCPNSAHLGRSVKQPDGEYIRNPGFSAGGAADHATRCPAMAALIGVAEPTARPSRGFSTVAEAVEAAHAKWSAKSAPAATVSAYEPVVGTDLFRKVR